MTLPGGCTRPHLPAQPLRQWVLLSLLFLLQKVSAEPPRWHGDTEPPPTKATQKQQCEPPLGASRLLPQKTQLLMTRDLGPQGLCLPKCLVVFPIKAGWSSLEGNRGREVGWFVKIALREPLAESAQ